MAKKCRRSYGFCINVNLEKAKKLLTDWWGSDFDIEINLYNKKNPIIFTVEYNGYWSDGEWHFDGKRRIARPCDEYMTKKFKEFFDELEKDGFTEREYTLEDAIEFIEDIYYETL